MEIDVRMEALISSANRLEPYFRRMVLLMLQTEGGLAAAEYCLRAWQPYQKKSGG